MKRFLLALLSLTLIPLAGQAAVNTWSHVVVSVQINNGGEALGEPDGVGATFEEEGAGWIELGFPEESTEDLTLYYIYPFLHEFSWDRPILEVEFWNVGTLLTEQEKLINEATPLWGTPIPYSGTEPYDRVRIYHTSGNLIEIDAIGFEAATSEEEEEETEAVVDTDDDGLSDEEEEALGTVANNSDTDGDDLSDGDEVNTHGTNPLDDDSDDDGLTDGAEVSDEGTDPLDSDSDDDGFSDGWELDNGYNPLASSSSPSERHSTYPQLVKLEDDGDTETTHDTAVYAIDNEGYRRPFTNETVYFSWFTDFSQVTTLSPSSMATVPLGAPMPMHQGTWLVKIQSANDVYAVEEGGVLRRIPDEATAETYYGPDWADRVRDLPPTDWPRYTVGEDLGLVHPDDMMIRDDNLIVWHVRNSVKRQIPEADLTYHGVQDVHIVPYNTISPLDTSAEDLLDTYVTGLLYDRSDDFNWYNF